MQDGILGSGVKIAYSQNVSPKVWTPVGMIRNVDVPGLNPDEVETTVHSTSNFKRFIRGLIDVTEMNVTTLLDLDEGTTAEQDEMFDLQAAGTTVDWLVEIPVDRERSEYCPIEFRGWIKKYMPKTPIAGAQELDFSVRFDGDSFTKGAAGASVIS